MLRTVRSGWNRKRVCFAFFCLHFVLVLLVSLRQTFWVLSQGATVLPRSWDASWEKADAIASATLGDRLTPVNPVRQGIRLYLHGAGIDTGYGFFAPNVSISHKLVFEVRYADGRVEYELPRVGAAATGLRLPLLLDQIARTQYGALRGTMLKMMAFSIWREHRNATVIRAVFGVVRLPGIAEFEAGEAEEYEFLYAYDFRFPPSETVIP